MRTIWLEIYELARSISPKTQFVGGEGDNDEEALRMEYGAVRNEKSGEE